MKYAVRVVADEYMLSQRFGDGEEAEEYIKRNLYSQMGPSLVKAIMDDHGGKVMIEMRATSRRDPTDPWQHLETRLVAEVIPIQKMPWGPVYEHEIIEPSWTAHTLSLRTIAQQSIPIEWQCDWCGTVNRYDKHLECRKCGGPRKART